MSVELIDSMGDDLAIVNAARVSFHKESKEFGEKERGILKYLIKNHHTSPLEQVEFKFRVRTPIKVAREWFRHRIGEFNEESTRYVKMRPDFYVPYRNDVRTQVGEPGHYQFEYTGNELAASYIEALGEKHKADYNFYQYWLKAGVAKELVSFELPMSLLTEFIWKANLHSVLNFIKLRSSDAALLEIREEAMEVMDLVWSVVPETMKIWFETNEISVGKDA